MFTKPHERVPHVPKGVPHGFCPWLLEQFNHSKVMGNPPARPLGVQVATSWSSMTCMIWMRNGGFFPVPFETLGCDPFHRKSRDQFGYTNCLSYHLPTKKKVTSKSFYSMARKKPTFPFAVGISLCQDHCWLFDGDVARARCLTWAAEATPGPSGVGSRWGGSQPCFFLADGLMILGSFWTVCWGSHEFYR